MCFAVVLCELVEHYGSSWHVDSDGKSFRGKHDLHKTLCKTLLHGFLEARYKTRVVHTYPRFKLRQKPRILQCR